VIGCKLQLEGKRLLSRVIVLSHVVGIVSDVVELSWEGFTCLRLVPGRVLARVIFYD
jgi:hypothetical protein